METKDSLKPPTEPWISPRPAQRAIAQAVATWEGEGGTAADADVDSDVPAARGRAEEQH
jgi:hypothetical protein